MPTPENLLEMTDTISKFKGLGVAVLTPFLPSGKVDFPGLESLIENLILNRVDYLLVLGTTSESATLSEVEKAEVARCIIEVNAGRLPVMMGLGGNNTNALLRQLDTLDFRPADAILSVAPYYNKPSQEGLFQHYKTLSEHAPCPVVLYNVPGRTSCNIEAATTIRIAEACPNVIAIKEASGNMKQILYLLRHKPKHFLVISGDDLITLPLMAAGADGLISVVANAFPCEVAQMVHLAQQNRFEQARLLHDKLFDITECCFQEGNPAGIKAVMTAQNKIGNTLRLPLVPVSDSLYLHIETLLKHYGTSACTNSSISI